MLLVASLAPAALANQPPATPIFTEPSVDGQIVNPADVHMETSAFSDADPGDTQVCSDWEIWTLAPLERVWSALCIGGVERVHVHLGDGAFEGSYAGRTTLEFDTDYRLRARHRDSSGNPATEWSAYGERLAHTGSATAIYALLLQDVLDAPAPTWRDEGGAGIVLPAGAPAPELRLESPAGSLLLAFRGLDGSSNEIVDPPALAGDSALRITVGAGSASLALPESQIGLSDNRGFDRIVYLPTLSLASGETATFWVSADGSTYVGSPSQTAPDFSRLARGAPLPWIVLQPGYKVEVVATGFQLPVNIAFVPSPGPNPTDPLYYVTELYGTIKVVRRNGAVGDYATGLLDFDPLGVFPGSGEQGLAGIAVDPVSGDVFATLLYDAGGNHYPKVVRFHSDDGGLTAATQTTILDMFGETQGQSHQISNVTIGPDGKLYVHMGDGFDASAGQDLDTFRGKVLRLNLDGTAPSDNPFFDAGDGITARDYVFAYGFRNPFGGAWSPDDGAHYEVENGPSVDRLARVVAGRNYGYDGSDQSMQTFALYNWNPAVAPVNVAFVHPAVFGGSGFPAEKMGHAFVSESGPTYASGPQPNGKRISDFAFTAGGALARPPIALIAYGGNGFATAVGLAAGPDGLYFTDLYKDRDAATPIDVGANVLRVSFLGLADFTSDAVFGAAPLSVHFTDASIVPSPTTWAWDFGDGGTSTAQNPSHTYASDGAYDVTLSVTGAHGTRVARKVGYVCVGASCGGLRAEYFADAALANVALTRTDPTVDFDWGSGSPDPRVPPDNFSVRWTGRVKPDFSETYRFYTTTDDGVRLWVNGKLVIDEWVDQPPTEWSGTVALTGGLAYDIKMEFYERLFGAVARLSWSSPSLPKETIPSSKLEPKLRAVPCPAAPDDTCRTPFTSGRSRLVVRDPASPTASKRVLFDWNAGRATSVGDFGDPRATAAYALCVYDGSSALVSETEVSAGGGCGPRPCWRADPKGFTYLNATRDPTGPKSIKLRAGGDGKARITIVGQGPSIATPPLPLGAPVRVQVRTSVGGCWQAGFASPTRNDGQVFMASGG
ncbi:MAG TPA: PQQ-dependent sugar dehydrogenase [Candidatus Binatia bacterium]|nr:PQQ-dependent sugar dehydrogenase [Candidatus Binatia bacterium]